MSSGLVWWWRGAALPPFSQFVWTSVSSVSCRRLLHWQASLSAPSRQQETSPPQPTTPCHRRRRRPHCRRHRSPRGRRRPMQADQTAASLQTPRSRHEIAPKIAPEWWLPCESWHAPENHRGSTLHTTATTFGFYFSLLSMIPVNQHHSKYM